jgi:5'-nucleotidase
MKPLILITNDDGITSPGLRAVAEAIFDMGEILIVAPKKQQTGMGRSFPKNTNTGKIEVLNLVLQRNKSFPFYSVTGSPAQAVAHGILEIAVRKPDLCISGVNYGENLGGTNFISGTLGAAMEAASYGLPSLAFSIGAASHEQYEKPYTENDWKVVSFLVRKFTTEILSNGLHKDIAVLNINIPSEATVKTEIRVTSQSKQNYYTCNKPEKRNFSEAFMLPIKVEVDYDNLEKESDIYAFCIDKVVSVTPIGKELTVRDKDGNPYNVFNEKGENNYAD